MMRYPRSCQCLTTSTELGRTFGSFPVTETLAVKLPSGTEKRVNRQREKWGLTD